MGAAAAGEFVQCPQLQKKKKNSGLERWYLRVLRKPTPVPGGAPMDANEEGFAARVGGSASGPNGEVATSTELLPVAPQGDPPAGEDGGRAFAVVVEEVGVAAFGSRLVFALNLLGRSPLLGIFFVCC